MSRIDDLIHQHCPGGVEYVRLGDLATVGTGSRPSDEALATGGKFPYVNGGVARSGFVAECNGYDGYWAEKMIVEFVSAQMT